MPCTLFSLLMLILFASISYYARSCGFEGNGEYANGIMVGEMTFLTNVTVDTTETGESLKNGKKIAPIIIWFDKKFIK